MHLITIVTALTAAATIRYEDKHIAAKIARSILNSPNVYAELGTIQSSKNGIEGFPYVSVQAISDHCPSDGKPFFMLVEWGSHASNLKMNGNASLFVRDSRWYSKGFGTLSTPSSIENEDRGKFDLPRFTLFGHVKKVEYTQNLEKCFESHHKDSSWKDGHEFQFFEMDVVDVNFIGGFGDEHYVGFLDMRDYLE
jgi:hypothetical protein